MTGSVVQTQNNHPSDNLHAHLQNSGFRLTTPRQMIIDIFASTMKHLSVEDIYLLVHKSYPNIGIATVYRTVELLVGMGAVAKFDFGEHKSRYELSSEFGSQRHHHHIVCTDCGRIVNYSERIYDETALMRETIKELSKKYHFDILRHHVQFFGICEKCKRGK